MWRFIGEGIEPIPGIPLEADDDDFNVAVAAYEAGFEDADGAVKRSGLYKHIPGKMDNVRERENPPIGIGGPQDGGQPVAHTDTSSASATTGEGD